MTAVAAAVVGTVGAVAGAAINASAAGSAAGAQKQAAKNALQFQQQQYDTTLHNLNPYMGNGVDANNVLSQYLGTGTDNGAAGAGNFGSLLKPFTADYMQQYDPAYKFALEQGTSGALNSSASGAGALSGNAQRGLSAVNTANAMSQYGTAFNIYSQQQQNIYNRLMGQAQLGETAAAQAGSTGAQQAANVGQSYQNIGNAQAAGILGTANAVSGGIQGLSNLGTQYAYSQALGAGTGGGWSGSPTGNALSNYSNAYGMGQGDTVNPNSFGTVGDGSLIGG